jgi:hypothetical protein
VKLVGLFALGLVLLGGCRTAHDVAVSSFHVLDAPANYVRHHLDRDTQTTTTTTTTTASSDSITTPGRTVTPSTATTTQRPSTTTAQTRPTSSPKSSAPAVTEKSKSSPGPSRNPSTQTQYPTAKPVPGKPGYVFSPFDPSGGYVDVTGYSSGQKVKDPYSGKIFLVP